MLTHNKMTRRRAQVQPLSRRDPEARRTLVLEHAARLFAKQGYEITSVNDVAEQAGVSVGALYKYFPDKTALLEGVLSAFEEEFAAAMETARQLPIPYMERLRAMISGLFELAGTREHFLWSLTSGTHGLRGERRYIPGERLRRQIALFIEDAIAAGAFRKVDAELVAALGFGVVETAMQHCYGPVENGARRAGWERAVYELLARNVTVAPPRKRSS